MTKLPISVVIVTRNRPKPLLRNLKSLPPVGEVIVVDNGSGDNTVYLVKQKFPKVKIIRLSNNTGAAAGRNTGAKKARFSYIYFLDDDAYVNKDTLSQAFKTIQTDPKIAIIQSMVFSSFNHKRILGLAHDVNTTTSLIKVLGIGEFDNGQYTKVMDIPMAGGTCLVRKSVFEKVGGFDEKFFIPYEDSDISLRIRKLGYRIVCDPKSKTWHDDLKPTEINNRVRSIGIASPERAYYVGRNKIYFMRKHSRGVGRVVFFGLLLPMFICYHCLIIISSWRFDILKTYLKGVVSGFFL